MSASAMSDQRPIWPLGVVLFVAVALLTPVLVLLAGVPLWVMPALAVAMLGLSLVQPGTGILGYPLRRFRMMFTALVLFTLWQASGVSNTQQRQQVEAEAEKIVSLGKTNPAQQASALANADDEMLAAIGKIEPALKDGEIARRDAAKAAANAPRIAELLAQGKKLDKDDVEGRITIWRELVSLAPNEADYRATLAELEEQQARAERIRRNPTEGVEVVRFNWRTDGFGAVMMLDITLRNTSSVELRDFVINCKHTGPSGTFIDRNSRTLYEKLAAGETRRFREVNMGFIHSQATTSYCSVDGAKAASPS